MFSLDMNKHLWRSDAIFKKFHHVALLLNKDVAEQNFEAGRFREYANSLDQLMIDYEGLHGAINDPIFFWTFATANALFLLIGKQYDELGPARRRYVINGYIEGLNRHLEHPSFPAIYIEKAFEYMHIFAENQDVGWIDNNKERFIPIPD